jgi:hypothetical protein
VAEKKSAPKGGSKLQAAILWGAAQWAVEWFLVPEGGLWGSVSAAAGGFAAGWVTVALLNTLGRWKVPGKALGVLGILFGVAAVSGAVRGLSSLFTWWVTKSLAFDVDKLMSFLLSWNVVPAAALGLLTGLWIGGKGKGDGKKKKD